MTTLGIDPGLDGAWCWVDDIGDIVDIVDMPTITINKGKTKRRRIIPAAVVDLITRHPIEMVWLEVPSVRPGEGARTALTAGIGWGVIEGALAALERPVTHVTPQEWTKAMRAGADKGAHVLRACELWPGQSERFYGPKGGLLDGRADAALIAAHGYALRPIGRRVSADSAHRYHLDPKDAG